MTPSKPSGEASLETLSFISKNDFSTAILLCRFKTTPPTLATEGLIVIDLQIVGCCGGGLGATCGGKHLHSGWHISLVRDGGGVELPL